MYPSKPLNLLYVVESIAICLSIIMYPSNAILVLYNVIMSIASQVLAIPLV